MAPCPAPDVRRPNRLFQRFMPARHSFRHLGLVKSNSVAKNNTPGAYPFRPSPPLPPAVLPAQNRIRVLRSGLYLPEPFGIRPAASRPEFPRPARNVSPARRTGPHRYADQLDTANSIIFHFSQKASQKMQIHKKCSVPGFALSGSRLKFDARPAQDG